MIAESKVSGRFQPRFGLSMLSFFSAQTALWAIFLIGSFFILKLITDEGEAPVRKSFGKCMKILKGKRREKNKRHPPIKRKVPVEYPCPSLSPTTTRSQSASHASESANTRYRIVNWGYLSEQLDKCAKCGVGPLNLKNTTNERQAGLGYLTRIGCDYCQETNVVRTDEVHTEMNQRGQNASN